MMSVNFLTQKSIISFDTLEESQISLQENWAEISWKFWLSAEEELNLVNSWISSRSSLIIRFGSIEVIFWTKN